MGIDYRNKAVVLNEHYDIIQMQREHSLLAYKVVTAPTDDIIAQYEAIDKKVSFFCLDDEFKEYWDEAVKINHAYYERIKRLKNYVRGLLEHGQCYFLTFTFNNATLENTSPDTRRRYVRRFLSNVSDGYVANIDFGKDFEREHYHAVVLVDHIDMTPWDIHGFSLAKPVRQVEDSTALSKYIAKLTNHAIKETTKGSRVIYSKNLKKYKHKEVRLYEMDDDDWPEEWL